MPKKQRCTHPHGASSGPLRRVKAMEPGLKASPSSKACARWKHQDFLRKKTRKSPSEYGKSMGKIWDIHGKNMETYGKNWIISSYDQQSNYDELWWKLGILILQNYSISQWYPLVNSQLDPENNQFLVETNLSTPTTGRVYVKLLESNTWDDFGVSLLKKNHPPHIVCS